MQKKLTGNIPLEDFIKEEVFNLINSHAHTNENKQCDPDNFDCVRWIESGLEWTEAGLDTSTWKNGRSPLVQPQSKIEITYKNKGHENKHFSKIYSFPISNAGAAEVYKDLIKLSS